MDDPGVLSQSGERGFLSSLILALIVAGRLLVVRAEEKPFCAQGCRRAARVVKLRVAHSSRASRATALTICAYKVGMLARSPIVRVIVACRCARRRTTLAVLAHAYVAQTSSRRRVPARVRFRSAARPSTLTPFTAVSSWPKIACTPAIVASMRSILVRISAQRWSCSAAPMSRPADSLK